jgi:hypothetical protein
MVVLVGALCALMRTVTLNRERMTILKDRLDAKIGAMLTKGDSPRVIARRLIFYDFTSAFSADEGRGFTILNEVSEHFRVPIASVRVVGSGQFGYSYFKGRDFTPKTSDLDLAIVSSLLFQKYAELSYWITDQYRNQVKFTRKDGVNTVADFREYLSTGYFRPDMMPASEQKEQWFSFFNSLSNKHADLFDNINAGIFLSDGFLEMRNANVTAEYRKAIR